MTQSEGHSTGPDRASRTTWLWRLRPTAVVVLVVVALAARIAVVIGTPDFGPVGDPYDYDRTAVAVSQTGNWPTTDLAAPGTATAYRPPAYPLVLAGAYKLIGSHYATSGKRFVAGRLVGALLGSVSVLLVFLLTRRLYSRKLAVWTAGVVALAPPLVWLNGSLLSESLLIPLVLALALCIAAHRERPTLRLAASSGVLLGIAILTRGNAAALAVPLIVGLAHGDRRSTLRTVAVAGACATVILLPWTVRNASTFQRFLPLGTQSGLTMAGQWNHAATKGGTFHTFWLQPQTIPEFAALFRRRDIDEGELDAMLRSRALQFAQDHPGAALSALATNLTRTFDLGPDRSLLSEISYGEMGIPKSLIGLVRASAFVLFMLAVSGGVLLVRRRDPGRLWLWLMPPLLLASTVLWTGAPRYLTPLLPFFAIPAGALLGALHTQVRARVRPRRSSPG